MTFLSILIALLIERSLPQLKSFRRFDWLRDYSRWMVEVLQIDKLGPWAALTLLIAPVLVATWLLASIFDNAFFGLFELAFGVIVVYLTLGPRELDPEVDDYLDALDMADPQARRVAAAPLLDGELPAELSEQARSVGQSLFSEALIRIYAPIFWFVLLGPVAAVAYRLLERLMRDPELLEEGLHRLRAPARELLGWMDWIPARLTLFAYMIAGRFDDGWQAFRRGMALAADIYESNVEMLRRVGAASIGLPDEISASEAAAAEVRKARGLILRSLVIWLLLVLALSWLI
jgi:AmpE protein